MIVVTEQGICFTRQVGITIGAWESPEEIIERMIFHHDIHNMLDGRYDEIKSSRVQPIDGEAAFEQLRQKSRDRRGS